MATGTKPSELRELSDPELVEQLREAKAELFNLRVQAATGQLDNNRRLHVVRKEIARIYTIIRERELGLSAAPSEFVAALEQAEAAESADGKASDAKPSDAKPSDAKPSDAKADTEADTEPAAAKS